MEIRKAGTFYLMAAALLGAGGCASRGNVRDQVEALEARQANLERLQERADAVTAALDRESEILRRREEEVATARSHALMASDQARVAEATALGRLLGETVFRVEGVRFEPASAELTVESRALLDQLAERLRVEDAGYYLEIQASAVEGEGAPGDLHRVRAETVRRYLHHDGGLPLHVVSTLAAPGLVGTPGEDPEEGSEPAAEGGGGPLLEVQPPAGGGEASIAVVVVRPFTRF